MEEGNGLIPVTAQSSDKRRLFSTITVSQGVTTLRSQGGRGGKEYRPNLLEQVTFEGIGFIMGQVSGRTNGLPQIAQFVEQTALVGNMRIHELERSDQTGSTIMDEQLNASFSVQPTAFQGS